MHQTVDINQAADLMKIHPKTVIDKIQAGELPAARIGRAYVLLTRDVLQYVEASIVRQTAQRMGGTYITKAQRPSRYRAGLRSA